MSRALSFKGRMHIRLFGTVHIGLLGTVHIGLSKWLYVVFCKGPPLEPEINGFCRIVEYNDLETPKSSGKLF